MMERTEGEELYEDIGELEAYESVKRFERRVRESTWVRYKYNLRDFFRYLDSSNHREFKGKTPDELIEYVKGLSFQERFDVVDVLLEYRKSLEDQGLRARTLKTRITIVRSFFMHNRSNLPTDPTLWDVKPTRAPVMGRLEITDIRDMILSMNETYQAVFTSMFQAGLDLDCFMRWNAKGWPALREALERGDTLHEIMLNGRKKTKNIKPFYTFIGKDALDKIRAYLPRRPEDGEAIFYTRTGKPVTKNSVYLMWLRHLRRLGKITKQGRGKANRYGMNPHEMRDKFVSQFQKSPAGQEAGQYFTGHVLDENEYAKAYETDRGFRIKKYREAEPYLSLFSDAKPYGAVRADEYEKRIHQLEKQLEEARQDTQLEEMRQEISDMMQRTLQAQRDYAKAVQLIQLLPDEVKQDLIKKVEGVDVE